jgi:hypothetical protein
MSGNNRAPAAGRGDGGVCQQNRSAAENSSNSAKVKEHLRANPRYRRLTERLHRLGPRPIGEAIIAVADGRDILSVLEEYAQLDPAAVALLDARDWPPTIWRAA